MAKDEQYAVIRHMQLYKREGRFALSMVLLALVAMILLLWLFILVQLGTRPTPLRFALTTNLQIIEPVPLEQPSMSRAALLNWINEVVIIAFSFNYSNMDDQPRKLTDYLDETGLQTYVKLLTTDEFMENVKPRKLIVSVMPKKAPEIIRDGVIKGRYAYQIRLPVRIKYNNAFRRFTQDMDLEFLAWRVPETDAPLGMRVTRFNSKVVSRGVRRAVSGF